MGNFLSQLLDLFHVGLILMLLIGTAFSLSFPLQFPRTWKVTIALWVIIAMSQAAFKGQCPLSILARKLAGQPESQGLIQELVGFDVPMWSTFILATVLSAMIIWAYTHQKKRWQIYDERRREWEKKLSAWEEEDRIYKERETSLTPPG